MDTVYVGGTAWSQSFKDYLEAGLPESGSGLYGVRAWTAGSSMPLAPWVNLNQVSVRFRAFGHRTLVQQDDLTIRGVNRASYAFAGFQYDPDTDTATWTLTQPIANDRILLNLNGDPPDGVREGIEGNYEGAFLDGGDFVLRLDILAGDASGNGLVNAADLGGEKLTLNRSIINLGTGTFNPYLVDYDVNADGRINALDLSLVKQRLNARLPFGEPAAASSTSTSLQLPPSPADELFGARPILA